MVCEGHGEDAVAIDPAISDQMGDAVGDDPGLAAAGAGDDKQGAVDGLDSLFLPRVQSFDDVVRLIYGIGE